jgi:hypothetical protein
MKFYNKRSPKKWIKVVVKKNKIVVKNGFVVIASGTDFVNESIRPDLLTENYDMPKNIKI